jgi:hypothetical protein
MGKGVSALQPVTRRDGGSQMKDRNAQLRVVVRAWCA